MHSRRARAACVLSTLILMLAAAVPAPATPGKVGRWISPFSEDADGDGLGDFDARPPASREESARAPAAVNVAVLSDGRILYWSQLDGSESVNDSIAFRLPDPTRNRTRVLDLDGVLSTGSFPPPPSAWSVPSPEDGGAGDLVGSEQRHLPDGRVVVIGGTEWSNDDAALGLPGGYGRTELYGLRDTRVFDPTDATWSRLQDMTFGRYYPTLVTMPDGSAIAFGGAERLVYNSSLAPGAHPPASVAPQNVRRPERFDPEDGTWSLEERASADASLPLFARLHLLPDGRVLYPAAGMLYAPGGGDMDADPWNVQRIFDPTTATWHDAGRAPLGVRSNAFSVLLPLRPPYDRAQVLVGGGTVGPWPSGYVATPIAELLTWDAASGTVERAVAQPMTAPRWHGSAVVSPTGEVVVLNGADRDEVVDPGSGIPVRHAEMYDPATGAWTRLASGARDRTLHNTAVLLRDGSILVGGHAPAPAHYGNHTSNPAPFSSNYKDPSFEIFQPPYLFRGERPVIGGIAASAASAGETFEVQTEDAADPTLRAVLVRLPSTTHTLDADQRTVELALTPAGEGVIRATVPPATVAPPGHYYLFLVADRGHGPTPSVAEIVRVSG